MGKLNLEDYRDNEFLSDFFALKTKVEETDLTQLSDDELQEMYNESAALKTYYDNLQQTVKLLANSLYGVVGNEHFRFYSPEVAGDITTEGKMFMFVVDEVINNYFKTWESDLTIQEELKAAFPNQDILIRNVPSNKDICTYGDTDSRYVVMGEVMKACNFKPTSVEEACRFVTWLDDNRIAQKIREGLKDDILSRNGDLGYMIMELEVIGGKGIFLAKKKYVMSLLWKDGKNISNLGKIKATGVEINQASSSQFVKNSIKAIINKLLTPGFSMMNVYKLGTKIVNRAMTAPTDELCLVTGIKEYSKWVEYDRDEIIYKKNSVTPAPQVRAAAEYNHFIHINGLEEVLPRYIGGKIRWYYAKNEAGVFGAPDGTDIADIPGAPQIDYERQVEKLIINPIKRYLFTDEIDSSTFGKTEVLQSFASFKKV